MFANFVSFFWFKVHTIRPHSTQCVHRAAAVRALGTAAGESRVKTATQLQTGGQGKKYCYLGNNGVVSCNVNLNVNYKVDIVEINKHKITNVTDICTFSLGVFLREVD